MFIRSCVDPSAMNSTIQLPFVAVLLLITACESGPRDWSQDTLDYYNPYNLTNAEFCPQVPGAFFTVNSDSFCETYFPATGPHIKIQGNPSYRYSVPLKKSENGQSIMTPDPAELPRCEGHPKIQYLKKTLGNRVREVIAGSGDVDLPNPSSIIPNNIVCKVIVAQD